MSRSPIVVALDFHSHEEALALARRLSPRDCRGRTLQPMLQFAV